MPCSPTCACIGEPGVECLAVLDPVRFANFRAWCLLDESTELNRHLRQTVLLRSRIGLSPAQVAEAAADPGPAPALPLAGDLVAVMTKRLGADRFAKWVARQLGANDCGCGRRQAALNAADAAARRYLQRFTRP